MSVFTFFIFCYLKKVKYQKYKSGIVQLHANAHQSPFQDDTYLRSRIEVSKRITESQVHQGQLCFSLGIASFGVMLGSILQLKIGPKQSRILLVAFIPFQWINHVSQVLRYLIRDSSDDRRLFLGSGEGGPRLCERLIADFIFPAARVVPTQTTPCEPKEEVSGEMKIDL